MALKTKKELKDVFNGLSSMMYQSTPIDISGSSITLDPEYDLPVTVDSLSISQDDPTINHYKVIGLMGDWCSSSTAGDMSISFTVPTKHTDVLKLAFGTDAYKGQKTVSYGSDTYKADAIAFQNHKVQGCFALISDNGTDILIVNNIALWAKPVYENASTEPFAVQFTGTIESDGTNADFLFLKKN